MKSRDFKLLATLPDGYEYRFLTNEEGEQLVIGASLDNEVIGFVLRDEKLIKLNFIYGNDK